MLSRIKFPIEPLVNEILDQLPSEVWSSKTTTFIDPAIAGGQFVKEIERRLLAHGHTKKNVSKRVFGFEEYEHQVVYAVNKHKLIGTYVAEPFIERDFKNMKFDVFVGNPPFKKLSDDGKPTSASLWKNFLVKSATLTKPNGIIAMVHPSGWCYPADSAKLNNKLFTVNNLLHADISTRLKEFFPGVGSTFSYTITKMEPYSGHSTIVTDDGPLQVNLVKTKLILTHGMSIISKLTESNHLRCQFKLAGVRDRFEGDFKVQGEVIPPEYKYKNINFINSQKSWEPGTNMSVCYSAHPSPHLKRKKVIMSYNGAPNVLVDGGNYGISSSIFLLLDDTANLQAVESVFKSKLFRFYTLQKYSQYNEATNLNQFPMLDITRVWTDADIYREFKLTQAEIDYVEAHVA